MIDNEVYWYSGMDLEDVIKQVICKAYKFYGRNTTKTAKGLGLSPKTVYNKLKQYGVDDAEESFKPSKAPVRGRGRSKRKDSEANVEGNLPSSNKRIEEQQSAVS